MFPASAKKEVPDRSATPAGDNEAQVVPPTHQETANHVSEPGPVSQDGFMPAKKGSGKPKPSRAGSSRPQPEALLQQLKQSCSAAHTTEDWQRLYEGWQAQVISLASVYVFLYIYCRLQQMY